MHLPKSFSILFSAFVLLMGIETANANVIVESRDEQPQNSAQTLLRIRVFNDSQDTLENVELHYFLSKRNRQIVLDRYHPQNLEAEIVESDSDRPYLKISVPRLSPGIFPDSGGLALGLHFSDWSDFGKNVKIYSLPEKDLKMAMQNNVKFTRASFSTLQSLWPYRVAELASMPSVGDSVVDVAYGKSLVLGNGDKIKTLKVHPGGTLYIATGEMYVENIQLESGSKLQFVSPGQRSVLHLNGSVIWRAHNLNGKLLQAGNLSGNRVELSPLPVILEIEKQAVLVKSD